MLTVLKERLRQKYRTMSYPEKETPQLPERFPGLPRIKGDTCPHGCSACGEVCPTGAVTVTHRGIASIDTGRCLFCRACEKACPEELISFTGDHRLAALKREDLLVTPGAGSQKETQPPVSAKLFRRSLKLRQVCAGGCNACEADSNVLSTPAWDMGRFGIQFTASPRHSDGILITGPVTNSMLEALNRTYEAIPKPRVVIAVGTCAISGGMFAGHPEQNNGVTEILPVDLFIPGCPPHPLTILHGLLKLQGRI